MSILGTTADTLRALNHNELECGIPRKVGRDGRIGREAESLAEASRDFEALFVRQLLTVMRRSVPEGNPESKAPGSELYTAMMDDAFAEQISRSGRGLGLAKLLMDQWRGQGGVLDELSHAE